MPFLRGRPPSHVRRDGVHAPVSAKKLAMGLSEEACSSHSTTTLNPITRAALAYQTNLVSTRAG
jgi:hypothetical protein